MKLSKTAGRYGLALFICSVLAAYSFVITAQQRMPARNLLRETNPEFFQTDEARRIGDQVLLYQRSTGGWPKNIDMARQLSKEERAQLLKDQARRDDSTIDNHATTMQLAYLARLYQQTRETRYRDAFRRGVEYLLSGQYDNGGWPQFWPDARGYHVAITYNDDAMINTLVLIRDMRDARSPYEDDLIDRALDQRLSEAFDKGIECILKTQIVVDDQPTVWCQQHDRETFQPTWARAYELPSYCSQESASIVRLLMELPDPDRRVKRAVHGAMKWFDTYKLTGLRYQRARVNGERTVRLVRDPEAGPLWARFYDLEQCAPYVCDRDGLPKRRLEEIGSERRNGYSWYGNRPAELYPLYEAWCRKYDPRHGVPVSPESKGANENGTYVGIHILSEENAPAPVAFPGAEGFGRYATGGRGGKVYHVTSLKDGMEEGTLRYALSQSGPRTVVFDVAGTIFLDTPLRINRGDLTIAGQTAPGQGICIARHPVLIQADNVIVRYLRFRVGNEGGGEPDGLSGSDHRHIIVDHCSISWSVDEACTIYGNENTSVQWCIISESLRTAGHAKGKHGYGAIVGGHRASFHHNLLAHHESRTPRLGPRVSTQTREWVDMRNNVIYNWAGGGCYGGEGMNVNIVNNYYKPGPATPKNGPVSYRIAALGVRTTQYTHQANGRPNAWAPMEHVWGSYYVDGNVIEGQPDVSQDNWTKGIYGQINNASCDHTFTEEVKQAMRLSRPLEADVVTTHPAEEAYRLVLQQAGCSKERDIIDTRIVYETETGTALYRGSISADAERFPGLIDTPYDVLPEGATSPWCPLSDGGVTADALLDTDGDGIPDVWEVAHGLNPHDINDGKATTLSHEGYTNLEVYLNSRFEI